MIFCTNLCVELVVPRQKVWQGHRHQAEADLGNFYAGAIKFLCCIVALLIS